MGEIILIGVLIVAAVKTADPWVSAVAVVLSIVIWVRS